MNKPLASIGQRLTSQFLDDLVAFAVGVLFYCAAKAFLLGKQWRRLGDYLGCTKVVQLEPKL